MIGIFVSCSSWHG